MVPTKHQKISCNRRKLNLTSTKYDWCIYPGVTQIVAHIRGRFFGVKRHVYLYEDKEDAHIHTDKHAVLHQRIRLCSLSAAAVNWRLKDI